MISPGRGLSDHSNRPKKGSAEALRGALASGGSMAMNAMSFESFAKSAFASTMRAIRASNSDDVGSVIVANVLVDRKSLAWPSA